MGINLEYVSACGCVSVVSDCTSSRVIVSCVNVCVYVCACFPAVAVRAPEIQIQLPHPERQVVHVTLKLRGSLLQKRVLGHASFPLTTALGGCRKELAIPLTTFDGNASGRITLKLRVLPLGVMVEDWVHLGQGVRSIADAPAIKGGVAMPPPPPRARSPPKSPTPVEDTAKGAAVVLTNPLARALGTAPQPKKGPEVRFHENPMQLALMKAKEAQADEENVMAVRTTPRAVATQVGSRVRHSPGSPAGVIDVVGAPEWAEKPKGLLRRASRRGSGEKLRREGSVGKLRREGSAGPAFFPGVVRPEP